MTGWQDPRNVEPPLYESARSSDDKLSQGKNDFDKKTLEAKVGEITRKNFKNYLEPTIRESTIVS